MKTTTETKRKADPQLTTQEKLKQIQTGAKNKRTTGGGEKKNIVITGKDGSKIIQSQKEEKFEETAVLRKKKNYVMYEAKLGTETTTDITKINAPKPKQKLKAREIEPRQEERIVQTKKRKEYLDNYQYHETKDIKNPNPRFQVIVEHQRLGDIIGGTFEETSYQRTVFNQGSNRPQITEKTTTTTKTGSAAGPTLRGNKSQVTTVKKTINTGAPQTTQTTSKRTTTTTTTKTEKKEKEPKSATGKKEIITETSTRRRNEGTGSKTETRTEKKTTNTGTRGGQTESSTTTKTTTKTTGSNPTETKTQSSTTTKTTTTRTTRTTGGDGGDKTQTTVTKTESKTESTGGDDAAGASSIRKKYAKGRFSKQ